VHTEHVSSLLPDYVRGLLDDKTSSRVKQHVDRCGQCHSDWRELQSTMNAIADQNFVVPSKTYFSSILPRIHDRLEKRAKSSWIFNPLLSKVALPLSAAIVFVVLAWHVPRLGETGESENPLKAVVGSATVDEIADLVQDQYLHQDWSLLNSSIINRALTNERFVKHAIIKEALASESISPFNLFADVSPQQFLNDLDDTDSKALLKRLETMEIL
jgi:hypothetical protein